MDSFFGYSNNGDFMKVLITGATSGIGYELGKNLAKRGHIVYLSTHTEDQLKYLKEKVNRDGIVATCFKMDITTDDINKVDDLELDCLINHASIGMGGSILYMDMECLRENYEVNVFSSFKLLKKVYNNMENRNIPGKIFVTSSLASMLPIPFLGCYTSSKAAISMLVMTIKEELKYIDSNISISLIEPGAYHTGFNQVMIDNKDKYLEKDNIIYKNKELININQRRLFNLVESRNYDSLINNIVKQVESNNPKFKIRAPFIQRLCVKLYVIFTR